eukprot:maker-scaffold_12-snap-gene-7.56-mRNA-1 protein AED:0.00 eAED:0.00 QI:47/1/1/1/0.6/0.33/6/11/658
MTVKSLSYFTRNELFKDEVFVGDTFGSSFLPNYIEDISKSRRVLSTEKQHELLFFSPSYGAIINATTVHLKYFVKGILVPKDGSLVMSVERKAQPDKIIVNESVQCDESKVICTGVIVLTGVEPGSHILSGGLRKHSGEEVLLDFASSHIIFDVIPTNLSDVGNKLMDIEKNFFSQNDNNLDPNAAGVQEEIAKLRAAIFSHHRQKLYVSYIGTFNYDGQKTIWREQFRLLNRSLYHIAYYSFSTEDYGNYYNEKPFKKLLREMNISYLRQPLSLSNTIFHNFATAEEGVIEHQLCSQRIASNKFLIEQENIMKAITSVHNRCCLSITADLIHFYYHPWGVDAALLVYGFMAGTDIFIFANSLAFTDAMLSQAARLVGAVSLFDLPNIHPVTWEVPLEPDLVTAPSYYAKLKYMMHNKLSNVGVIHPGVDTKNLFKFNANERFAMQHNQNIVIGFMGRVETEKSIGLFVHMAAILQDLSRKKTAMRNISFIVIGEGVAVRYMMYFAKILNVTIKFTGSLFGEELVMMLKKVDILVNPSLRTSAETFCIANMEGLALGIPLVTFGVGGVMDYVIHGVNGILVEDYSGEGLAKGVTELIEKGFNYRYQLGKFGAALADRRYGVENMVHLYESTFLSFFACSSSNLKARNIKNATHTECSE